MTRFVLGATTVQFNVDPVRPGGATPQLRQPSGRDGSGALYVYSKSSQQRTRHRLRFNRLDEATRTALLAFIRTNTLGVKNCFAWTDHAEVSRSVRFERPTLRIEPLGPGRYKTEIILLEDV